MFKIIAEPWVGKDYEKGINGCKVLGLGESHYCANPSDFNPEITRNVISDLYDPQSEHEPYKNTYAKFINALAGEKLDFSGKEKWWGKIAFYNYVQTPMTGARVSPSIEDFKNSEEAFFKVIEKLRPSHIIVWGKRLFEYTPSCGQELPSIKMSDGTEVRRWEYVLKDGLHVKLMEMKHPSTGFSTDYWNEAIQRFLTLP